MPETLQMLMEQARLAGPLDRIEFRDRIASHGDAAVPEMTSWLQDPALGGFAIRVLERIGREPDRRDAVVDILVRARAKAPESLRGDIDLVLIGFGRRVSRRVQATPAPRARA